MYNLNKLTLSSLVQCGSTLRVLGNQSKSIEEAGNKIVRYLYDEIIADQTKAFSLVRFYKSVSYKDLPPDLQEFASSLSGNQPESAQAKFLTLLSSAGEKEEWNSRKDSVRYKIIPMVSEKMVQQNTMITHLLYQFGIDIGSVVKPSPQVNHEQKPFNIFYISEALGNPYIPAQKDFVIPYGIKSVLGFGGLLPSGDIFAVVLFAKVFIPKETAEMFKPLALNVKLAILPFGSQATFAHTPVPRIR